MTETDKQLPPKPYVRPESRLSMVWLIPLLTAIIGGWLVVKTISEKGPQIEISFKTAEGIEAGKTKVKYKEIEVGLVSRVAFSKDLSSVVLFVSMDKGTEHFLGRGTRFWVVKPTFSIRGASGLNTLLSGAYIEIEPGEGDLQKTQFTGLDRPPVVKGEVVGTKLKLVTRHLGSIDTGSPVYYQGILAGEVLGWELGDDKKSIFIHAFVKAPYNDLVQGNTKFWNISGINLSMGAEGISLRTDSLTSMLYGGIAFETPETSAPARADTGERVFTLYDDYSRILDASFVKKMTCVLYFDGSVRGLVKGAPVEFKGIKVGQVRDIQLAFNRETGLFEIPVHVEMELERFLGSGGPEADLPEKILETLIKRGLRARLQTGSLLTGQLFVELGMHPNTPVTLRSSDSRYPELPTVPADLDQMLTSIKTILFRMESLDINQMGKTLLGALQGANKLIDGAGKLMDSVDTAAVVSDFTTTLVALRQVLQKLDQRVGPLALNLENAIGAGHKALEKAGQTMGLLNQALDPNAPLQFHLIELSGELSETARSIRTLVDMLERNPNAVIFGKPPSQERGQ